MISQTKYELENLKMRKKQHVNSEVEEAESGDNPEVEEAESGDNPETEKTENDKITELEKQLDTYRLEYARMLLENSKIGGDNYHALNLIDMTSKDTIKKDVERLVEICKTYDTGRYSNDNANNNAIKIDNDEFKNVKSADDLMQKTFGTGKWRGKPWL